MDAVSLWYSLGEWSVANPLVQSVLVGLVRGLAGWIQHAMEDGKIELPELKELGSTMLRLLPQSLGLSALGLPAVGALFSDVFVTKLAKAVEKKK